MKQHLLTLFTALLPILVSAGPVEINGIWYNLDTEAITAEVTRNPNIEAFMYCSSFTTIRIPVGVTSIGDWAFYKGSNLTSITIPESVEVQGLTHNNYTGGFEATMLTDKEDLRRIRKQVYATLTTHTKGVSL